jgi:hypothetical protein
MIFEHRSPHRKTLIAVSALVLVGGIAYFAWAPAAHEPEPRQPVAFGNDQVERAITDYLLTQSSFSWTTRDDSRNFCVVENLDGERELFPLFVWAYCTEVVIEDGVPKTVSGSSGPVKIDYPNELSFYDISRFTHEQPGDGAQYADDIKRIFPENVQRKIFSFDRTSITEKLRSAVDAWVVKNSR